MIEEQELQVVGIGQRKRKLYDVVIVENVSILQTCLSVGVKRPFVQSTGMRNHIAVHMTTRRTERNIWKKQTLLFPFPNYLRYDEIKRVECNKEQIPNLESKYLWEMQLLLTTRITQLQIYNTLDLWLPLLFQRTFNIRQIEIQLDEIFCLSYI